MARNTKLFISADHTGSLTTLINKVIDGITLIDDNDRNFIQRKNLYSVIICVRLLVIVDRCVSFPSNLSSIRNTNNN